MERKFLADDHMLKEKLRVLPGVAELRNPLPDLADLRVRSVPVMGERHSSAEVVQLSNRFGRERFGRTVTSVGGSALVVVHPFYVESTGGLEGEEYTRYKKDLVRTVENASALGTPIIIFEQAQDELDLPGTLTKMGKESGEVYYVPTEEASPRPSMSFGGTLFSLAGDLRDLGMQHAVVTGSYLNTRRWWLPIDGVPDRKAPVMLQEYKTDGCVDATVKALLAQDVSVDIGVATYPGFADLKRGRSATDAVLIHDFTKLSRSGE